MRILLIGNPVSGRGKTPQTVRKFVEVSKARGHEVVVEFTTSIGSAESIASSIAPGFDCLVVSGGDGTINEVINSAKPSALPPILVLATGTANILARELSLPKTVPELVQVMERGKSMKIDMGVVNNRKFLMLVSSGFDALVTRNIALNRPTRLGFRGYVGPIIKSFSLYRPNDIHVTADGNRKVVGKLVIVQKIRKYGGIFEFSNEASLTSGVFEVCVFSKGSLGNLVKYGLAGVFRVSRCVGGIQRFSARNIRIEASPPNPVEVDGDYFGETPVDISLSEEKISVLIP